MAHLNGLDAEKPSRLDSLQDLSLSPWVSLCFSPTHVSLTLLQKGSGATTISLSLSPAALRLFLQPPRRN